MDVLERAGLEVESHFLASTRRPALPTTVHWRLDCQTSGTVVQDWTELTPESETDAAGNYRDVWVEFSIPGSLNDIVRDRNKREQKILWIVANKDLDNEFSETQAYWVINRSGRT
jgi:hypothetical protein